MTLQRRSLRSAPAVLNTADKAIWVTGWNEAVDALEAEQAQAVEPVAIYDIGVTEKLGAVHLLKQLKSGDKLYTHPTPQATGERAQAVEPHGWMINGMSEVMSRGHAQAVQTEHQAMGGTAVAYPVYLHPAPPPTIKEPLKVHASAEDYMRCTYGAYRGHFAWREIEKAYSQGRYDELQAQGPSQAEWDAMEAQQVAVPAGEHVPETAFGNTERAELIAGIKHELAEFAHNKTLETLLLDAADMLEADAQEIAGWKADQKENLRNQVELQEQINDLKAQQVAVPVTKTRVGNYLCRHESGDNTMFRNGFKDGVKFAEAHHGIKAKPDHTDWSAA